MSPNTTGKSPRLLVIGARGFLGTFATARAGSVYNVIRGDRNLDSGCTDVAIDIVDPASVKNAFNAIRPDAVLLLAAISDIDRCQRDPTLAASVNLHGANHVANECARSGARLLFTSTGAVFNGLKHGYVEDDPVTPISVYGETKAQAEASVQSLVPSAIILRVSLVLGRTNKLGTNSLIDSMIRRWNAGEVLFASTTESRNPIDAPTLSQWIVELLGNLQLCGVYHAGSTDSMTRFELARCIAERTNTPSFWIQPELQPPPGKAPRGPDHLLLTTKISKACKTQPAGCLEVIERSLNEVAEGSLRTGV